ncbi:hypothetical protein Aasi_0146 [Candidatus Amoebophilus asiaticus 5a2]|uniref:Uncharacterized protein n=1 Tax=Amoebophilus asiaticus (strain 5a2) TaxID=452471 RepID=B3EUH3_AMOA5|nr:hypothetical protein [Candidatus Amoebophilus asiaticus]ACE05592.1 hypothetical protein Aasi_0146 [Candidatus Amoebophilus asiaticus 5a2]
MVKREQRLDTITSDVENVSEAAYLKRQEVLTKLKEGKLKRHQKAEKD